MMGAKIKHLFRQLEKKFKAWDEIEDEVDKAETYKKGLKIVINNLKHAQKEQLKQFKAKLDKLDEKSEKTIPHYVENVINNRLSPILKDIKRKNKLLNKWMKRQGIFDMFPED